MLFCKDVDLLYWEPDVTTDAAFASQTLGVGTGSVGGTTFVLTDGAALTTQHVEPGQMILLSGAVAGTYAITAIDGPFQLSLSALHADLFPEVGDPPAGAGAGTASGVGYAIRTFWAQRRVVSDLLVRSVGLAPEAADAGEAILNPGALKRACVLGTLQMIYSAVAAAASEPARFIVRSEMYARLYRRALLAAQVDLDLDGDGRVDARRSPGLVRMVRV